MQNDWLPAWLTDACGTGGFPVAAAGSPVRVAKDNGKEVFEIVGDAASQYAKTLEFMYFLNLPFHPRLLLFVNPARGEVARDGADGLAVAKLQKACIHFHWLTLAVVRVHLGLQNVRPELFSRIPQRPKV